MKRFCVFSICLITIIFSNGCSAEDASLSQSDIFDKPQSFLLNKPEKVKDGTISENYYKEMKAFYESMISYSLELTDIRTRTIHENDNMAEDNIKNILEYLDKGENFLEEYSASPTTNADEEMHELLEELINQMSRVNDLTRKELKSENSSYEKVATLKSMLEAQQNFDDVLNKYELYK